AVSPGTSTRRGWCPGRSGSAGPSTRALASPPPRSGGGSAATPTAARCWSGSGSSCAPPGTPDAVVHDLLRYRALLRNLVATDLKLKYRDSLLGVVWSLIHPLLMLVVYPVAFRFMMRVRVDNYPYFLLAGLLPCTFFAGSLVASTHAITANA